MAFSELLHAKALEQNRERSPSELRYAEMRSMNRAISEDLGYGSRPARQCCHAQPVWVAKGTFHFPMTELQSSFELHTVCKRPEKRRKSPGRSGKRETSLPDPNRNVPKPLLCLLAATCQFDRLRCHQRTLTRSRLSRIILHLRSQRKRKAPQGLGNTLAGRPPPEIQLQGSARCARLTTQGQDHIVRADPLVDSHAGCPGGSDYLDLMHRC